MKILRCYIQNFGSLSAASFDFSRPLTVFRAGNGGGKSTLCAFIKAMFYGLEPDRTNGKEFSERRHYYPFGGGAFGGNLVFEYCGDIYKIERSFDIKSQSRDIMTVYKNDMPYSGFEGGVGEGVFGIDKQSFERTMFFCGEREIGVTGDISARLAARAKGADDGFNLERALTMLERKAKQYKKLRQDDGLIARENQRIAELASEIDKLDEKLRDMPELYKSREHMLEQRQKLQSELQNAEHAALEQRDWDNYDRIAAAAQKNRALAQEIERKYPCGVPDEESAKQLREAFTAIKVLSGQESGANLNGKSRAKGAYGFCAAISVIAAICGAVLLFFIQTAGIILLALGLTALAITGFIYLSKNGGRTHIGAKSAQQARATLSRICKKYALQDITQESTLCAIEADARAYAAYLRQQQERDGEAQLFKEQRGLTTRRGEVKNGDYLNNLKEIDEKLGAVAREIEKGEENAETKQFLQLQKEQSQTRLEEYNREYKLICAAKDALLKADQTFKEGYISPVKAKFTQYAAALESTLGTKLTMTADFDLRYERGGTDRSYKHLSDGQLTLVAMCMRMAFIENLFPQEPPFLILDDPFTDLDAEHMKKAAALLKRLSERMQIIYFTCHESREIT